MLPQSAPCLSLMVVLGLASAHCSGSTASTSTDGSGGGSTTGSSGSTMGGGTTGPASATGGGSGVGGGSSGTGGAGGAGSDCPTGIDGSTLAGNWTATGTRIGGQSHQVHLTLDAQHLDVQTDSGAFSVTSTGPSAFNLVYTVSGAVPPQKNLTATHQVPGQLNLGVIPIDLSGSWSFRNVLAAGAAADGYGCDATLSARTFSGTCSATRLPTWVSSYDPGPGSTTGTKIADAASVFGDLSGSWSASITGGTCTFRFEGSTFTSDCGPKLGGMRISFCGSMASGTTSGGIEFSALRM